MEETKDKKKRANCMDIMQALEKLGFKVINIVTDDCVRKTPSGYINKDYITIVIER